MSNDIFKTEVLGDDLHATKMSSSNIEPDKILNQSDGSPDIGTNTGGLSSKTLLPTLQQSPEGVKLIAGKSNRYESKRLLGKGGGGEVELVLDKDIFRLVAIKRLRKELHSASLLMRFIDEIRIVGHLEHPNIVPIHDVGKDENGQYYFIMKYVYGETLQQIIEKLRSGNREYHKKYIFQQRINIFREILKAVEFAHYNGIIHRDLKPANIMIGPHGEVMVMDWGIAKRIRGKNPTGGAGSGVDELEREIKNMAVKTSPGEGFVQTENDSIIGTPAYMAPEQVTKQPHDDRTDIYSLSALFYEFLTLKPYLTTKDSMKEVLKAVLREKPKFAMTVRNKFQPAVPADLSHILSKGLEKNPEKRYQSVRDVQIVIDNIMSGHTPVQCPFTLTKRSYQGLINIVTKYPMSGVMFFLMLVFFSVLGFWYLFSEILQVF